MAGLLGACDACKDKDKDKDDKQHKNVDPGSGAPVVLPPAPTRPAPVTVQLTPYEAASEIVDRLGSTASRIRVAVEGARSTLTVAERTAMMAAWVAIDSASTLSVLWRDQVTTAPTAETTQAATRLEANVATLLAAADRKALRANAINVYNEARQLAVTFKVTASRPTSMRLPTMTAASCKSAYEVITADLGTIATSELLLATTRPGFPWISLPAAESVEHLDPTRFVKPRWIKPPAPTPTELTNARNSLTKLFGNNATRAKPSLDGFDRGVQAGFSSRSALVLAEANPSNQTFALVRAGVKKQVDALSAAPAADAFSQIGALLDGLTTGARARSVALAAGKNPGVINKVAPTAADNELAKRERELLACLQLPPGEVDRDHMFIALAMIRSYTASVPGDPCPNGQPDCAPGQTCSNNVCVSWCGGCPTGDTCSNGKCALRDKTCQGPADCGGDNSICNGGLCAQKCGTTTCGSTQTCMCGAGETLSNGECVRNAQSCTPTTPCPVGETCVSNQCRVSCGALGNSCPNDQKCVANACQPRTEQCTDRPACTLCAADQFCDGGQTPACKSGTAQKTCSSDDECKPPPDVPSQASPRCVTVVSDTGAPQKMCIGIGWACNTADDCGPGNECDRAIGQCVDRETYDCNNTNKCRSTEQCLARDQGPARCGPSIAAAGVMCERNDRNGQLLNGECRIGTWQTDAGGAWQCVTNARSAETCDGKDNDCNNVIDDKEPTSCTAQAPGLCARGTAACSDRREICIPGPAQPEICDGQDNDCSGTPDDNIMPTSCAAQATGECANGTKICGACQASAPSGELCDGKDNNCDGQTDNLGSTHQAQQQDAGWNMGGGLFGWSENFLVGPKHCGGVRDSAAATKHQGGNSWCEVQGWANDICNSDRRHHKVGNSDFKEVCKTFDGDGPDNGQEDCRYIVHIGIASTHGIVCSSAHIVNVSDRCQ